MSVSKANPLLVTLHLPAPLLKDHNIEIFTTTASLDNCRVPTLQTPASASGRYTRVTYPVHRVIIHAKDLRDTLKILAKDPSIAEEKSVQLVVDELNGPIITKSDGIASLVEWIRQGTVPAPGQMKVATRELIDSILSDASASITRQEAERLLEERVSEETRQSLTKALESWAQRGHTELRDQLDYAFTSRIWQKITWWKLFWRVDDVGMIASDVLQQHWLREAEKRLIWLSGRLEESGLMKLDESPNLDNTKKPPWGFLAAPPAPSFSDLIPRRNVSDPEEPWPSEIPSTRAQLSNTTIPPLQRLAQSLIIQTVTLSTTSTAFAGLLMYAFRPTTAYEVGVVAALGVVVALKRLQGRWEAARRTWESIVREEGRKALNQSERSTRRVLEEGGRPTPSPEETREQSRARDAVQQAEEALRAIHVK